jgi:hypothetical protein
MSNTSHTALQYDAAFAKCYDVFVKKTHDYGTAWRILRTSSLTDQIYIKAQRIRTIELNKTQKVNEGIEPEFIGIINYSIMALIQLDLGTSDHEMTAESAISHYQNMAQKAKKLMENKNHDYGEAWRNMRISSFTDLILMKILRIKQIESNQGKTLISEGIDANYLDIINYAIFALIKLSEQENNG